MVVIEKDSITIDEVKHPVSEWTLLEWHTEWTMPKRGDLSLNNWHITDLKAHWLSPTNEENIFEKADMGPGECWVNEEVYL